ncbi:MAG: efflux RND transporter periplasmic adaptor subunit [Fibrobacter sp.]|jgi:multidrug efflux pump subunit AcrA (membrane-fusion protein)|nr:efflux RND transporter periplasmic adaptor subunit [Fibrobacter sp.]
MKNKIFLFSLIVFSAFVGAAVVYVFVDKAAHDHVEKKEMYHCPMHPAIIQDHFGTCPLCGMDLVLVKEESVSNGDHEHEGAISVNPAIVQSIGVTAMEVKESDLKKTIRIPGMVNYNAERMAVVNTRVAGWVLSNPKGIEGTRVRKGAKLAEFYSPDLIAAQEEFLHALKIDSSLAKSAKRNLEVMGLSSSLIEQVETKQEIVTKVPIDAPIPGVIIKKNLIQGDYISAGTELYRIADLNTVWITGYVYPKETKYLKLGMNVSLDLSALQEKHASGKLSFISPMVDFDTKTTELRVEFNNTNYKLKPGMDVDLFLHKDIGKGIQVPNTAVIRTGERNLVILSVGDGHYKPQNVLLGEDLGENIQILEGLAIGDSVVTSAHFLLDSESNLRKAMDAFMEKDTHAH